MEDKQNEVLKLYDFKVQNKYRARGAWVLDTDKGIKLLKNFEGSLQRLEFEDKIKNQLAAHGMKVDMINHNVQGNLFSVDSLGNKYLVHDWFQGEECNLHDLGEIKAASENLASLHIHLSDLTFDSPVIFVDNFNIEETFDKHNRELKRVNSYIRDKNKRNEFEICVLNSFSEFYEEGLQALDLLKSSFVKGMILQSKEKEIIFHGSYTYHNVLMMKKGIATVNFEKASVGVQMLDFYYFIRKTMEKNDWNMEMGSEMIHAYNSVKPLDENDIQLLYILLLYPEKYWKIINYYYNNKKAWISQRNIQKLICLIEQNKDKKKFLQFLKRS